MKISPLLRQDETMSTFKSSFSLKEQYFISDADTDMASMENHGRESSLAELGSCQSVSSNNSQEEWPWISPPLRPLTIPNKPIPVWTDR